MCCFDKNVYSFWILILLLDFFSSYVLFSFILSVAFLHLNPSLMVACHHCLPSFPQNSKRRVCTDGANATRLQLLGWRPKGAEIPLRAENTDVNWNNAFIGKHIAGRSTDCERRSELKAASFNLSLFLEMSVLQTCKWHWKLAIHECNLGLSMEVVPTASSLLLLHLPTRIPSLPPSHRERKRKRDSGFCSLFQLLVCTDSGSSQWYIYIYKNKRTVRPIGTEREGSWSKLS